jgi:hypothetical protein
MEDVRGGRIGVDTEGIGQGSPDAAGALDRVEHLGVVGIGDAPSNRKTARITRCCRSRIWPVRATRSPLPTACKSSANPRPTSSAKADVSVTQTSAHAPCF